MKDRPCGRSFFYAVKKIFELDALIDTRLKKIVKSWVGKVLKCEEEPAKIKEIEDKHKENGGIYNGKWKVFTAWRT